ncbi:hypothetical protein L9F63_000980, partial [Diploptera punctata]
HQVPDSVLEYRTEFCPSFRLSNGVAFKYKGILNYRHVYEVDVDSGHPLSHDLEHVMAARCVFLIVLKLRKMCNLTFFHLSIRTE